MVSENNCLVLKNQLLPHVLKERNFNLVNGEKKNIYDENPVLSISLDHETQERETNENQNLGLHE